MHFNQNELVASGETELLTKMGLLEISVTTLHDEIYLQSSNLKPNSLFHSISPSFC